MKKILMALLALAIAPNASAMDTCPANGESCALDPFAPAIYADALVCSERQPQNAKYYQAAVKTVFYGHPKEYAEIHTNPDFQAELRAYRKKSSAKTKAEQDDACSDLLSMGKEAAQQRKPGK